MWIHKTKNFYWFIIIGELNFKKFNFAGRIAMCLPCGSGFSGLSGVAAQFG